jgi:hypothetical protein
MVPTRFGLALAGLYMRARTHTRTHARTHAHTHTHTLHTNVLNPLCYRYIHKVTLLRKYIQFKFMTILFTDVTKFVANIKFTITRKFYMQNLADYLEFKIDL